MTAFIVFLDPKFKAAKTLYFYIFFCVAIFHCDIVTLRKKISYYQNSIFNMLKMIKSPFFVLLVLGFLLSFSACKSENKEAETLLNQEIMKVHDEVMPKMGDINRMKRQLSAYKDEVPDDNAAMKDSLINAILLLAKTEDNMNDWMAGYKYPNPEMKHDDIIKYLKGQQDTIKQINDDVFMTIAIGNGLLKNAPKSVKE